MLAAGLFSTARNSPDVLHVGLFPKETYALLWCAILTHFFVEIFTKSYDPQQKERDKRLAHDFQFIRRTTLAAVKFRNYKTGEGIFLTSAISEKDTKYTEVPS